MKIKPRVQVIGAGRAKRSVNGLLKCLAGHNKVLVGVQKGAGTTPEGISIAEKAAANHFGTDKIPQRRFLDVSIENNQKKYAHTMSELMPQVLDGKLTTDQMLMAIGEQAAGDVRQYIDDLKHPPNAPLTIAIKGVDNPLVDSGNLKQSIQVEIAREPVEEGF